MTDDPDRHKYGETAIIDKNIFNYHTVKNHSYIWLSQPMQELAQYLSVLADACLFAKFNTVLVHITHHCIDNRIYLQDLRYMYGPDKLIVPAQYIQVGYYADGLRDFLTCVLTNTLHAIRECDIPRIRGDLFGCSTSADLRRCLRNIRTPPHEISENYPILIKVVLQLLHIAEKKMTALIENSESDCLKVERGLIRAFVWTLILDISRNDSLNMIHGIFIEFNINELSEQFRIPAPSDHYIESSKKEYMDKN